MNQKNLDLSVIIVNYNSKKFLQNCLKSVFAETSGLNFEVFVVDNNSSDGSTEKVKKLFPKICLIQNSENVGFAKANNQAIAQSKGRYVLPLNPDTRILSNAISKLVRFMDMRPDAGAAGCKVLNPDGSLQYSIRNFPTFINQLSECFFLHRIFPRIGLFSEMVRNIKRYQQTQVVDWASGAVLIVRREAINQIGMLDENFFLYSEEEDWCYRAWQAGWKVYFYPKADIIHHSGEYNTNQELFTQLVKSRFLFFKKHKGGRAIIFRWVTYLNLLIRTVLWYLAVFLRGKQAEQRLNAYRYCIKSLG